MTFDLLENDWLQEREAIVDGIIAEHLGFDDDEAPQGYIWRCRACNRMHTNRFELPDESCYLNAELISLRDVANER
jgi:hypothetical protein